MIDIIFSLFEDRRLLGMICAAVAAAATVITLAMPLLGDDRLERRMAAVAAEREKIRLRGRSRLLGADKGRLRTSTKEYMGPFNSELQRADCWR
jgi:tight adherence protein C